MTNPPDPESVAAGLTKAQREAVIAARWREEGERNHEGWYIDAHRSVRVNLCFAGLIRDYLRPSNKLTPLGLAVRSTLQAKETK